MFGMTEVIEGIGAEIDGRGDVVVFTGPRLTVARLEITLPVNSESDDPLSISLSLFLSLSLSTFSLL